MEIVFFIVGVLFAAVGVFIIWDFHSFKHAAVSRKGQVVAYAVRQSRFRQNGGSETYAPVVQYHVNGQQHQFTASIASSQVKHQIGDVVPILVHKTDPSRARLDSSMSNLLGGVFLVLGMGAMIGFFSLFRFDTISLGVATVVIVVLLFKIIRLLNRNNIRSMDDIKTKLAAIKQTGLSTASKEDLVISDAGAFKRHVKRRQTAPVWILLIFLVVGLSVASGGIYLGMKRTEFLQTTATGYGIIVDFNSKTSSSDNGTSTVYYPVVEYSPESAALAQRKIRFQHDIGTSHPSYRRGEEVKVLYSPQDPNKAIIDQGWMNYFGPLLMVALGLIFTIVGASLMIKQRRQKAEESKLELDF